MPRTCPQCRNQSTAINMVLVNLRFYVKLILFLFNILDFSYCKLVKWKKLLFFMRFLAASVHFVATVRDMLICVGM